MVYLLTNPRRHRRLLQRAASLGLVGLSLAACGGVPPLPVTSTAPVVAEPSAHPTATAAPSATPVPTATLEPSITPTSTPEPTATVEPTATPPPAAERTMPRGTLRARPWTVMIDNHPGAYPQSGLDQAAFVFEGLAEYGITRFMATYVAGTPAEQIGPIRSTRLYFAQLAMGMHPIYGHAGGSPDGKELVRTTTELVDFDADGSAFAYRDQQRAAPHNLYTTSDLLASFAQNFPLDAAGLAEVGYLYDAAAPAGLPVNVLRYYFEDAGSRAAWSWDAGCACYLRSQRDQAHADRLTGQQLTAKNVVVMEITGGLRAGDAKSRIDQYVVGGGRARIFRDGVMIDASWDKPSEPGSLRFVDAQGAEIPFAPGAIWIAGVPSFDHLATQ